MSMHNRTRTLAAVATLAFAGVAVAQDGPSVESIIGKATEALGGEKIHSLQSVTMNTTPAEMMGVSSVKVQAIFPDHFRCDAEMLDGSKAMICSDGKNTWAIEPGQDGYDLADDNMEVGMIRVMMAPQIAFCSTMYSHAEALKVGESATFNDAECNVLEVPSKLGLAVTHLYFDAKTGLPSGLTMDADGENVSVNFDDWADADGIQCVSKSSMNFPGAPPEMMMEFEFGDFEFNGVKADAFKMPDEVKEQLEEDDDAEATDG